VARTGSFTSISLANPLLIWTNDSAAATIDRTRGFQFTWSGGTPARTSWSVGSATSSSGVLGSFQCLALADAHQFTVPFLCLTQHPCGGGGAMVQNSVQSSLTANRVGIGLAIAAVSFSAAATYTNGRGLQVTHRRSAGSWPLARGLQAGVTRRVHHKNAGVEPSCRPGGLRYIATREER